MNQDVYLAGSTPEFGRYYCTLCGMVVTIDEQNTTLPICDKCKAETWRRLR